MMYFSAMNKYHSPWMQKFIKNEKQNIVFILLVWIVSHSCVRARVSLSLSDQNVILSESCQMVTVHAQHSYTYNIHASNEYERQ